MAEYLTLQIACEDGDRKKVTELLDANGFSIKGDNAKITAMGTDAPLLDQLSVIEQIMEINELDSMDKNDAIKEVLESSDPTAILAAINKEIADDKAEAA